MRSDELQLQNLVERLDLDGQVLLLPTAEAWTAILAAGELDGRPVGVGRLPEAYRKAAAGVSGLNLALGADLTPDKPWWVYHLVRIADRYQRVQVEGQKHDCGWGGVTANPRVMAVYLGTDDPLARMRENWDTPLLPCPRCGGVLDRPAAVVVAEDPGPGAV